LYAGAGSESVHNPILRDSCDYGRHTRLPRRHDVCSASGITIIEPTRRTITNPERTAMRTAKNARKRVEAQMDEVAETRKAQHDLEQNARRPAKKGGKEAGTPKAVQPRMDRTGGRSARKTAKTRARRSA
jgi:hypothetical protein